MAEEEIQETNDNPADSENEAEVTAEEKEPEQGSEEAEGEGAPSKTEGEPEFKDKDMQAKFTQKMQELSEKEKNLSVYERKAKAFDDLRENPDFVNWFKQYVNLAQRETEIPEVSDEEFEAASTDKKAFQNLVNRQGEAVAKKHLTPFISKINELESKVINMENEQDIDDFANQVDKDGNLIHPDFWELDEKGLIEPELIKLRKANMTGLEKVDYAYMKAKFPNLKAEAIQNAHKAVQAKRKASGETGTGSTAKADTSKLSFLEFAERERKRLGLKELP